MDGMLEGKVAVVAGASRKIGLAIANRFAEAGADLLMVARGRDELELRAKEIAERTGRRAETLSTDLHSLAGGEELIEFAARTYDRLDVLVYNAYVHPTPVGTTLFEISSDDWWVACQAHLVVPFRVCQAFAKRMIDGDGGTILHVGTTGAFLPFPEYSAVYGSTKAALWHLTRYMANWWAPKVRANMIRARSDQRRREPGPSDLPGDAAPDPAAADRAAGRGRRGGAVPRLAGLELHHRPDDLPRRRARRRLPLTRRADRRKRHAPVSARRSSSPATPAATPACRSCP
jgi:NAD(P)-dependent dehydrogenase (short-subunit alcohol dehydrogenase family)